ncbi:protein BLISTER-like [Primulina tabacum]|uniref:protein BLISTER-like n=1 Tax=Primulina tabacum TaxID=48773 RepID=UPI003F59D9F7
MASAQVSRKQGHLEAGKKKFEEFRRKKAAEKAKKAESTPQQVSDGLQLEKQASEEEVFADSSGVGISYDNLAEGHFEPSVVIANNRVQETETDFNSDFSSSIDTNTKLSLLANNVDGNLSIPKHSHLIGDEYKGDAYYVGSDKHERANHEFLNEMNGGVSSTQVAPTIGNDDVLTHRPSSNQEIYHASSHFNDNGIDNYPSIYDNTPGKDFLLGNSGTSVFTPNFLPKNSIRALLQDKLENGGYLGNGQIATPYQNSVRSSTNMVRPVFGVGQKIPEFPDTEEKKKFSGSTAHIGGSDRSTPWSSNDIYADYSDTQLWLNRAPQSPTASGRRSRPSFLDSIQISKGPASPPPLFGATKVDSSNSKVYPMDSLTELDSPKSVNSVIASSKEVAKFNHFTENKHDFLSRKQNEDFAALEQHIEDLTQEKFSLQRAMETSRALAESLASENSTLTDSFNQQGSLVNQLKFDLEKLQEEIKAQLVELEAVKIEYANAQLECHAADERAKLLASEVIGLEEKALRLRSNELKLERLLENSQAEVSSYRKKMSSLEKDRQDLQSTVDALQEEKKLLQVKLRKASASGRSVDIRETSTNKKEMSTSTEDLGSVTEGSNLDSYGTELLRNDDDLNHENIMLHLEGLPLTIPSDQARMIQNINTLIAELALEKDQLMQALSAESSQRSKLSEINKEFTRKLESQTQRLELLMSQSMANENIQPRQPDLHSEHENTAYADEGDEVVERVLGWILRLFPGGPSKQRTSKRL